MHEPHKVFYGISKTVPKTQGVDHHNVHHVALEADGAFRLRLSAFTGSKMSCQQICTSSMYVLSTFMFIGGRPSSDIDMLHRRAQERLKPQATAQTEDAEATNQDESYRKCIA